MRASDKQAALRGARVSGDGNSFPTLEDEKMHDLVCAIIEQAVYDWKDLEYGTLKCAMGKCDCSLIYSREVERFFQGEWFEFLASYIPGLDPSELRKELKVGNREKHSEPVG